MQVEGVGIGVCVPVIAIKAELNTGSILDRRVHGPETLDDVIELHRLQECKIEVLGKPVVAEIASLERCATLESKNITEVSFSKGRQEPRKAVLPLEDALRDSPGSHSGQAVRERRDISLGNQLTSL